MMRRCNSYQSYFGHTPVGYTRQMLMGWRCGLGSILVGVLGSLRFLTWSVR